MLKEPGFFGKIFPKKAVSEKIKNAEQVGPDDKEEPIISQESQTERNESTGLLEGLSLEERLQVLSKKKSEIDALQERRREFYIEAKNLEDKMIAMGITDEQKKEIRNQITAEGGEISEQISQIKKDYGIETAPVEILSLRYKMLEAEAERIKQTIQYDRRELKPQLEIALRNIENPSGFYNQETYQGLLNILNSSSDKKIPEVAEFLINTDESYQNTIFKIRKLIDDLTVNIETNSIYKTSGEIEKAEVKLARIYELCGEIESDLEAAQKKSGRFAEKK